MAKPAPVCDHPDALAAEESDLAKVNQGKDLLVYFCRDCGTWMDDGGEKLSYDPSEEGAPQAGKAFRPHATSAARAKKAYHRDRSTMVTVPCSGDRCKNQIKLYPQNVRDKNWCPQLHGPLVRLEQARERQRNFRRAHPK